MFICFVLDFIPENSRFEDAFPFNEGPLHGLAVTFREYHHRSIPRSHMKNGLHPQKQPDLERIFSFAFNHHLCD